MFMGWIWDGIVVPDETGPGFFHQIPRTLFYLSIREGVLIRMPSLILVMYLLHMATRVLLVLTQQLHGENFLFISLQAKADSNQSSPLLQPEQPLPLSLSHKKEW